MRGAWARWAGIGAVLSASSCLTSVADVESKKLDAGAGAAGASGIGGGGGGGGTGGGTGGTGASGGASGSGGAGGVPPEAGGSGGTAGSPSDAGPDVTPVPGLLGHWPFDDGSGAIAVDLISGNDATLPDDGTTWTAAGAIGGALTFSGPTTPLRVTAWEEDAFPTTGTLTLWVKAKIIANDTASRSIFENWSDTRNHLFVRRPNGSTNINVQCAFQVAGQPYAWVKQPPIVSDTWQFIAIAWSSSYGYCFVQGAKSEGAVTPGWSTADQHFTLGQYLDGSIDDLRLWDYMLSDAELAKLLAEGP